MHRLRTHHSAMHLPRSYHPYIFPTTPTTHCTTPIHNTLHHPQSSPSLSIHASTLPSNRHPHILIHNNSHTTQNAPHNTTSLNLHSNIILFPRKHTPLTNPTLTSTNQATLTNTHNHTIQPTSTTMLHTFKSYQHPTDTIPNTPTLSSPSDLHSNTAPITTYQHTIPTSTTLQYIQSTSQHPPHTLPNAPTLTSPTKNIHSQTDFQHIRITSQHSTILLQSLYANTIMYNSL